jgi:hypothetical protein
VEDNWLDDDYHSPCANLFTLTVHKLALEELPNLSSRLDRQISRTHSDLMAAMNGSDPFGYCSQPSLKEEGVTALLVSNISKCFAEYCHCLQIEEDVVDRVSIMHQGVVVTSLDERGKRRTADIDISMFYRFLHTDKNSIRSCFEMLFPLCFVEFTKESTKSVNGKFPQASTYANHLITMMDLKRPGWVPLLGIIMSEKEMFLKLYSPSLKPISRSKQKWHVAEVDVLRCGMGTACIKRLLHVMSGWMRFCANFLCPKDAHVEQPSIENQVLLVKSNILVLREKVFKSFDYRVISGKSDTLPQHRRDPGLFFDSRLRGVEFFVDWKGNSPEDTLQIISYDIVPGDHYPSFVGHFFILCAEVWH